MADVPLGAFLSGGLDSSLIVALMKALQPGGGGGVGVRTFSVGFSGDPFSELHHAKTVADAIGTEHLEVNVGPEAFVDSLASLSNFRDGPVSEPADVAIAALSRVAKQHVKVVLSGEGADEAFAGYPKYLMARVPAAVRFPMSLVGAERVARMAGWAGLDRRRALVAARSMALPRERDRVVQWFSYTDRDTLENLLPGLDWNVDQWERTMLEQRGALARVRAWTAVGRMQGVDCLSWLPGNMLERGDRMTMAQGLELRPPFLDKRLVAFGLALPDRMKVRGRTTKWIVRQWAARRLPASITKRPKWGFKVPLAQWFRGELRDLLFGHLTSSTGLCATYGDGKAIRRLLEAHDSGTVDANLTLWTLLAVEVWYQDATRRHVVEGGDRTMTRSLAGAAAAASD
jgi:asparagine synthase (glutamine-hydrolysing)